MTPVVSQHVQGGGLSAWEQLQLPLHQTDHVCAVCSKPARQVSAAGRCLRLLSVVRCIPAAQQFGRSARTAVPARGVRAAGDTPHCRLRAKHSMAEWLGQHCASRSGCQQQQTPGSQLVRTHLSNCQRTQSVATSCKPATY